MDNLTIPIPYGKFLFGYKHRQVDSPSHIT